MGIFDGERAERPECAGNLQMRDHDHHAEQKRDGVEIDGVKGFLEAQGTDRDHRRAAEEGDARAVEPQARNPAHRHADIGQHEDDERYGAFGSHDLAAPSSASGSRSCAIASSLRVSGMKPKKTRKAMAAAAPRARKVTL